MNTLKINYPDGSDQTFQVSSFEISQQREITPIRGMGAPSPIELIPGNETFSVEATIDTSFWKDPTNEAPEIPARTRYDILLDKT